MRAFTYNVNSCSAHAVCADGQARRKRLIQNLKHLLRGRDFGLLQETKWGENEGRDLEAEIPHFKIFRSNHRWGSAGVATLVRSTVLVQYKAEVVPLPSAAQGHVLVLRLTPRKEFVASHVGFDLVNVYLESGMGGMEAKAAQLRALKGLGGGRRVVLGGDFNFVSSEEDCSGPLANACLTGDAAELWDGLVADWGLQEISQGSHTRFRLGKAPQSSRLDRWYVSSSQAELAVSVARTYVAAVGQGYGRSPIGLSERIAAGLAVPRVSNMSDHFPVGLDFFLRPDNRRGEADVPAWAAEIPFFWEGVKALFGRDDRSQCCFAEIDRWKRCVREVFADFRKGQKDLGEAYGGQARKLSLAVTLFRMALAPRPDVDKITSFVRAHTFLVGMVHLREGLQHREYEVRGLEDYIAGLYGDGVAEARGYTEAELDELAQPCPYLPGGGWGRIPQGPQSKAAQ